MIHSVDKIIRCRSDRLVSKQLREKKVRACCRARTITKPDSSAENRVWVEWRITETAATMCCRRSAGFRNR